jgi:hypothetical protein
MDQYNNLAAPLKQAVEDGVDLTQLYERLRLTPTQRIKKHFQMLRLAEELRKTGREKRDSSVTLRQSSEPALSLSKGQTDGS